LSQRDLALSKRAEEQLEQERRDAELARRLQQQLNMEEPESEDVKYAIMRNCTLALTGSGPLNATISFSRSLIFMLSSAMCCKKCQKGLASSLIGF